MTSRKPAKLKLRRAAPEAPNTAATLPSPLAQASYFEVLSAHLPPRLSQLRALTKAGVRGAYGVDDAQALLALTLLKDRVRGEVLDLTAMGGLLSSVPGVHLRAAESSAAALSVLHAGGIAATPAAPGDVLERAPTACLVLSGDRGNAYAQAQVAWAHACTRPGDTLYLAGDKDKGFDRYVRAAAALFGSGETIARDGGMRVAKLVRRPGPSPAQPAAERYLYPDPLGDLTVIGLPGVFSAAKLDKATALLLEVLKPATHLGRDLTGQAALDLGCGAGVLGAWAARRGAHVTLVDADLQSVRSAQQTLKASSLSAEVLHSDVDNALGERTFDLIVSNPPFHVGRGVVLDVAAEFIRAAQRRLRPGGHAYWVANDFLPYEGLMNAWAHTEELARQNGFKVLKITKV